MRKFSVRIEHGNKKGVKICDGFCKEGSRITTSANRCVLFNVLRNKFYLNFNGLNCVDLCCGSGIVGFEFLSLGAKKCLFVDNDRTKLKNIDSAIIETGFSGETICAFLPSFLSNEKFDLIYFDPPYKNSFCQETIDIIHDRDLLSNDGILIVETLYDIETKNYEVLDLKHLKMAQNFSF